MPTPAESALALVDAPPAGGIHLVGAPRAGKSYVAADVAMTFGALYQPRHSCLVVTKVLAQWQEIWVPELMQAAQRIGMLPIDEDKQTRTLYCGPWRFVGRDAKDSRASERIQGVSASVLIVDELPNIARDVWIEARKRLTGIDGIPPLLITTCNPGPPGHYAKLEVVDKGVTVKFPPGSNPTIDLNYYHDLQASLHPIEWERVKTCEWLPTSGLIYPRIPDVAATPLKDGGKVLAGIDAGMSSPTAMVVFEEATDGTWQVTRENYFTPYESRLTVDEVAMKLSDDLPDKATLIVDPSASELRQALRALGRTVRAPRFQDVRRGIGLVRKGIADGSLTIRQGANIPNGLREFGTYAWDEKASARGKDEPLKRDDHWMDALRYGWTRCVTGGSLVTSRRRY